MFGHPDFFRISLHLQDILKISTAGSKLRSEAQGGILIEPLRAQRWALHPKIHEKWSDLESKIRFDN